MTSRSQKISAVLGVSLLLALTGCFLLPEAPSSVPTPSATLAPALDREPQPRDLPDRVPYGCAALIQPAAIADALEVPESSITLVEEPLGFVEAVAQQGGELSCIWTGASVADQESPQLAVQILAGAALAFHIYQSHHPAVGEAESPGRVDGALGDDSRFSCVLDVDRVCSGNFESGGYWVQFTFGGPRTEASTADADDAVFVGERIQTALTGSGAAQVYTAPAGYLRAWTDCAQLNHNGSYLRDLGSPSLSLEEATADVDLGATAFRRAGAGSCRWTNESQSGGRAEELYFLETSILPGGEWAWPEVLATAIAQPESAEEAVPGATEAVIWCAANDDSSDCSVVALVEHSILTLTVRNSPEGAQNAHQAAVDALRYLIKRL